MGNILGMNKQNNENMSTLCIRDERIKQLRNEIATYEYMINQMQKTINNQRQTIDSITNLSNNDNEILVDQYITKHSNMFLVPDHVERKIIYRFLVYYNERLRNEQTINELN